MDLLVVGILATMGILMTPVSLGLILPLLAVVGSYLLVLDQLKVRMFRHLAVQ
jgi:hypothetical protein